MHESRRNLAPFDWLYLLIRNGDRTKQEAGAGRSEAEIETERNPEEGHQMLNYIKNFRNDEDGAVTVDWVVLTAAIVGLGIAVLTTVGDQTAAIGDNIQTELSNNGDVKDW
jgi:Flp pilus assembly pilin Flp